MKMKDKSQHDALHKFSLRKMYKNRKKKDIKKKSKRKVQGVPQSQAAALPRHQEEEETDKTL